jgi:hypothetical protein
LQEGGRLPEKEGPRRRGRRARARGLHAWARRRRVGSGAGHGRGRARRRRAQEGGRLPEQGDRRVGDAFPARALELSKKHQQQDKESTWEAVLDERLERSRERLAFLVGARRWTPPALADGLAELLVETWGKFSCELRRSNAEFRARQGGAATIFPREQILLRVGHIAAHRHNAIMHTPYYESGPFSTI